MRKNTKLIFLFFLLTLLPFKNALADFELQAGELQLDVSGILLDIEENSTIDNISFDSNSFTVTLSPSQTLKISSSESRGFALSPSANSAITCPTGKSVLTITMPSGGSAVDFTITPGASGSCSSSDGGGGGGGGGGEAAPAPAPAPEPTPIPPPPEPTPTPPPPELTPEPTPTPTPPEPTPEPTPIPPPPEPTPPTEIPSAVSIPETVESVQAIGSSAVNIGGSIGGGIVQIFQGFTVGQKGSADIIKNFPNSGSYVWNTNISLLTKANFNLEQLIEGNDYTISISSALLENVKDASDSYFSFVKPENFSYLNSAKSGNLSYFLKNSLLIAEAQEIKPQSIKIISPNGGEFWNIGGTYEVKWSSENLEPNHPLNIALYKNRVPFGAKDTLKILKGVNQEIGVEVNKLRQDKTVVTTVKSVAVPISVTVTAASAGALTVTATAGSATFALNLSEFFQVLSFSRLYLLGLIRFKKKKPWGKVSNKLSGAPLSSATVQIYEAEFKKLKDSQITDEEGRFGAFVGPGKYYIKVSKKGFQTFQSEIIEISSPDQILNFEFYLSPTIEEWSLEVLKKINVLNALKRFIEVINPYLLAFGTIVSVISVIILPTYLNYAVFYIYIILDLMKIYFAAHLLKPFGKVIDETTGEPLPLTVVRIFEEKKNWLLSTKVTDEKGRFNFLLTPGQYYLTLSKAGYEIFRTDTVILKKTGLPSLNVKLKRAE